MFGKYGKLDARCHMSSGFALRQRHGQSRGQPRVIAAACFDRFGDMDYSTAELELVIK